MKKPLIIAAIYLSGCVVAYKAAKKTIIFHKPDKVWTVGDRSFALFASVFSWITVVAASADYYFNSTEKAEW
jgi:hypothetical protein